MSFLPLWPVAPSPLLLFSLVLLAGLGGGEVARHWLHLPRITGYVLVGVIFGGVGLAWMDRPLLEDARVLVDIALGLVLYELGRRLDFQWLRRDRWLLATGLAESTFTFLAVYIVLTLLGMMSLWAAVAAAVAMATSPAVVIRVVRDSRAEGQVTERVLCLTAINCVAAVVALTVLTSWVHMEQHAGWVTILVHPIYLLFGSILLAWVLSACLIFSAKLVGKREEAQFVLLVGFIVLAVSVSQVLKLSVLLTILALGVLAHNMDDRRRLLNVEFGYAGQLFFVVLFVLTGAGLVFAELQTAWLPALAFIVTRSLAKMVALAAFGSLSGIGLRRASLIGLALTPMTGIAVILVADASALYPKFGVPWAGTILTAVALLELVGPLATQFALKLAGESNPEHNGNG